VRPPGGTAARRGAAASSLVRHLVAPRVAAALLLASLAPLAIACRLKQAEPGDGGEPATSEAGTPSRPGGASPGARPPAPAREAPPFAQAPGSFADVASRLAPNVVALRGPSDPTAPGAGPGEALPLPLSPPSGVGAGQDAGPGEALLGTGFLLAGDAVVVTSARVVSRATELTAELDDGRRLAATLRGADPALDLAVLSLDEAVPAALPLADASRLRAGDWVAVLSRALGAGTSVTAGVVRFTADPALTPLPTSPLGRLLGVDAAVDAANWGGPVVDAGGRLVGLATAAPQAGSRIGLVVPAPNLRRSVTQLVELGRPGRSWVGLWVRPLDGERAAELGVTPPRGLLVSRVAPGSPAQEAGLVAGDVVLELAGTPVGSPAELATLADRVAPGESAPLAIVRAGRLQTLRLRPAPMPQ
jgi:S1-C subfamily serine protease